MTSKLQTKHGPIYANNRVYSPEGELMFRCSDRKLDWYSVRGLALDYDDGESVGRAIRLTFAPRGKGRTRDGDAWYLEQQTNRCVVCGAPERLTLHHVVPAQYRRHMPDRYKSHGSHDVLPVCIVCHAAYEGHAEKVKNKLVERYAAPRDGVGWIRHDVSAIRSAASALLNWADRIPEGRLQEYRARLERHYGGEVTENRLQEASALQVAVKGPRYKDHGLLVVEQLNDADDLDEFVRMWRRHFIECMSPAFLSTTWSTEDPVFVES
ncbi:hypothetical protein PYCC9005_005461 [Savitreella phatthalungensis]